MGEAKRRKQVEPNYGKCLGEKKNIKFLEQILETISVSGNKQILYQQMRENIDKIDEYFAQTLRGWAEAKLSTSNLQQAKLLAGLIVNLGISINEFTLGNQAHNQEIAITSYEAVLKFFPNCEYLQDYQNKATTLNNLGNAYQQRIRGEHLDNIEVAIIYYKEALDICEHLNFIDDQIETESNLGVAYYKRIRGERADNIETAINYYQSALQKFNEHGHQYIWAGLQYNLGNAYSDRIRGDRSENLELAISFYQRALNIYTRHSFPHDWAMTQNSLGHVYSDRIQGKRSDNVDLARNSHQKALQVYIQDLFPYYWAKTQIYLGCNYLDSYYGNISENIEIAICCFQNALQVFDSDDSPMEWSETQLNMGNAYIKRVEGERFENAKKAISYYEKSLNIRSRDAFPEKWALVQNNIAGAYILLEQVEKAIASLQLALEIYLPKIFPLMCLNSGRRLGNIAFFKVKQWHEAIQGYSLAIEAVETSRTSAPTESRRQEILEQAIDIYQNIVQACINAGQIEKAFEYAERSRSKRLVDLMASNDLYQGGEIPKEVEKILQQYNELQKQIDQERYQKDSQNNRESLENKSSTITRAAFEAYNETIATLEYQKRLLWEQIRRLDPVLAGEIQVNPLKFAEIQKLVDQPTTAILSFYTTNTDTYIFVLRQNQLTLHTCAGQGIETFQSWISQYWLFPYMSDKTLWENQMQDFLEELAQRLEIKDLITQNLKGIEELILVPHLLLHQIPFAALPIGNNQYLADKFIIRYIPSCQVLEFCKQRPNIEVGYIASLQYGTVEDANNNLACAAFEGEQITNLYNIALEKRLIGSQATCNNYQQLAKQVQVLHSCHHAQSRLDNPLESQLKLADGSITLGQLMSPGWRLPNLSDVFLSCCETNLGVPSLTDDIFTLSTGFLCAGARSVVSSLWAVDDLATALFSIFYYEQRQKGENRPQALRQAQIKLREIKQEDLTELSKLAEFGRKEARSKRSLFQAGSAEYLEWHTEYRKYAGVSNAIWNLKKSAEEFPFAHPRYWSAFICQGLR
ncbi:TPR repeat-containing protein [Rivularia sp. IAM M-261]|nr:TPR repeat-containing protein [Rivularia sp. IAM M-261]